MFPVVVVGSSTLGGEYLSICDTSASLSRLHSGSSGGGVVDGCGGEVRTTDCCDVTGWSSGFVNNSFKNVATERRGEREG